jgi:hypothetical protein
MFRKIAVLSIAAIAAATSARAECQLKQFASLDVVATDDGVIVPVTLEGKPGAYMTLDMAGIVSVISEASARALDLRRSNVDQNVTININGHRIFQRAEANIRLGGSKGDAWIGIIPEYKHSDPRVVGILAMDVLNQFDIELDLAHDKLNLFNQDHCRGQVVYWTKTAPVAAAPMNFRGQMEFVIPMTLDDKNVDVELTTGPVAALNGKTAHDDFGLDNADGEHTFKLLAVDGLGMTNVKLAVYKDETGGCNGAAHQKDAGLLSERDDANPMIRCYGRPELFLGYNQLKHLRIFLAYKERMMYATAADAN